MIWNAFAIAVREIGRNLTRAFLTVLGIFSIVQSAVTIGVPIWLIVRSASPIRGSRDRRTSTGSLTP